MTTCELCGEREHNGPCYLALRMDWIDEDRRRWLERHSFETQEIEAAGALMTLAFRRVVLK